MKTTRRRLLTMLGLGAAAAALPTGEAAAKTADSSGSVTFGKTDGWTVSGQCTLSGSVATQWDGDRYKEIWPAATIAPHSIVRVSGVVRPVTQEFEDAIAQARADGYNRGREVEEARQEARRRTFDA